MPTPETFREFDVLALLTVRLMGDDVPTVWGPKANAAADNLTIVEEAFALSIWEESS